MSYPWHLSESDRPLWMKRDLDALRHSQRNPAAPVASFGVALSDGWHYIATDETVMGPHGLTYRGHGVWWSVQGVALDKSDRLMMQPGDVVIPMPVGTEV